MKKVEQFFFKDITGKTTRITEQYFQNLCTLANKQGMRGKVIYGRTFWNHHPTRTLDISIYLGKAA